MTLHIEIDCETLSRLAEIASLNDASVEEVAAACLKRDGEEYIDKLRYKLKVGEESSVVEGFSINAFLDTMHKKHVRDAEV